MTRSTLLVGLFSLVSAWMSPVAGQAIVAISCFELREVRETPIEVPDTVQLILLEDELSAGRDGLSEHPGLALGRFVEDALIVDLPWGDEGEVQTLRFLPEGDRMVGWLVDSAEARPEDGEAWEIEAHRSRCAVGGPGG